MNGLQSLMARLGLEAPIMATLPPVCFMCAQCWICIRRPISKNCASYSDKVSALVCQFKGSLAGEHGVGIARTEYMQQQVGENLLGVMAEIKAAFDPHNLFNPGKIVDDHDITLIKTSVTVPRQTEPAVHASAGLCCQGRLLRWQSRAMQWLWRLPQGTATMCPTFIATGDEIMSTRGRANTIRAVLENRGTRYADPLASADLETAFGSCLSCKACTTECPSNVNLALLKAELLYARIRAKGLTTREKLLSNVDRLGRLGCLMPRLANRALDSILFRSLLKRLLGLAWQRSLPHYARQRFDTWFWSRGSGHLPTPWPGRPLG